MLSVTCRGGVNLTYFGSNFDIAQSIEISIEDSNAVSHALYTACFSWIVVKNTGLVFATAQFEITSYK